MRTHRRSLVLAVALTVALTGCAPGTGLPPVEASASPAGAVANLHPTGSEPPGDSSPAATDQLPSPSALPPGQAPTETFSVGTRQLDLARGDRPLRTDVWYPSAGVIGGGGAQPVAPGVFALVLFSHGLRSSPEAYAHIARRFAAAGFVVAAPAYPYTSSTASSYNPADLINQPADGSAVITALLALNTTPGDPLAGHLDPARVAAAGHSGGAFTTVGMLAGARDDRLRAAIVLAGGSLGGAFHGPPTPVLFVHGDQDPVVSYPIGRAVFAQTPWPKAFLTVRNGDHGSYLHASTTAGSAVLSTMLDFLRWTLYADRRALARLPGDALVDEITTFESTL